ncbi:MAG: hypothetical protein EPO32_03225 [Anaerolineae bacterium]|nr:MAG: hypothetical protein EPO32_03225 [Anaerolineae bacterium]
MTAYTLPAPLVVVHNYLETFREFLSRSGDPDTLMARRFNGDQALFWYGPEKLVFTSAEVKNADTLKNRWGYEGTRLFVPDDPSPFLSLDIARSSKFKQEIVAFAGPGKAISLIPYASTRELFTLADTLRTELGLAVHLPESPRRQNLWVKDYIDTKAGFRTLVPQWLDIELPLPRGFITDNLMEAADMVAWFEARQHGCVVKANKGGSGVGNLFLPYHLLKGSANFRSLLDDNIFLQEDLSIVEQLIEAKERVSPSLEYYVPPVGEGAPALTYLSNQHFEDSGRFAGVIIASEFYNVPWAESFSAMGSKIADRLQNYGYVGYFDIDAIIDDSGRVYIVEINSRRTGGTFAHDFLLQRFGPDYCERIAALSYNKAHTRYKTLESLEAALGEFLYPMKGEDRGVIITLTSTLHKGDVGMILLGNSLADVTGLYQQVSAAL